MYPVTGEMLKNPPVDLEIGFSDTFTLFPSGGGWVDFHQYGKQEGDLTFGKDLDIAVYINLFSSKRVAFTGMAHEIFQGRHLPDDEKLWLFSPRLIISDLRLFFSILLGPVTLKIGYHHDCAHAIDRYTVRNVIHEAFLLGGETRRFEAAWGRTGFSTTVRGGVEAGINILAFIQAQEYEPDRFRFSLYARVEPVKHPRYGSIFTEGRVSLMVRETVETPVQGIESPGLDWLIRGGYRTPGKRGGVSIYVQKEHITDGWEDRTPEPVTLFAMGIMMSIDQP